MSSVGRPLNPLRSVGARLSLALVAGYLIWFAVDNRHPVNVHWVFGTTHSSLIWVILVTLILGAIAGWLALYLGRRRSRRRKRADR